MLADLGCTYVEVGHHDVARAAQDRRPLLERSSGPRPLRFRGTDRGRGDVGRVRYADRPKLRAGGGLDDVTDAAVSFPPAVGVDHSRPQGFIQQAHRRLLATRASATLFVMRTNVQMLNVNRGAPVASTAVSLTAHRPVEGRFLDRPPSPRYRSP